MPTYCLIMCLFFFSCTKKHEYMQTKAKTQEQLLQKARGTISDTSIITKRYNNYYY